MLINWSRREINLKLVYYGPALSGKTTNLEQIHRQLDPSHRSELVSLKTSEDRTLFFDFMQLELGMIGGLRPKFSLYTVPGQVMYAVTRKIVLQGADGVVFVVDSAPDRLKANVESWRQLHEHLRELRLNPATFPIVVQFNKRDLPDALPLPTLTAALRFNGHPSQEASALRDMGVRETLRTVAGTMLKQAVGQRS
jgi:signal recognition particle receptor subunit beta